MDDDLTEPSFFLFVAFIQTFIVSRRRDNCQFQDERERERERDKTKVTAVMVPVTIVLFYEYGRCNRVSVRIYE
jgi:hypothetical protein